MKPLVFVTPDEVLDKETGRPYYLQKRSYAMAVSGAGMLPMMPTDARLYKEHALMADGLLLTDGSWDINPARYGEIVSDKYSGLNWYQYNINYTRDSFDIPLCKAFIDAGKPVFGIGRGMHIINVVLGGTLYADLAEDGGMIHPVGAQYRVLAADQSSALGDNAKALAGIIEEAGAVRSYNHQGIKTLGKGLRAVAWSENDAAGGGKKQLVEAVCHETLPVFGVQWNAETYKTNDDYLYAFNHQMRGPILMTPEEKKEYLGYGKTRMEPVPGVPTDKNAPRPEDNALFNFFGSLCKVQAKKEGEDKKAAIQAAIGKPLISIAWGACLDHHFSVHAMMLTKPYEWAVYANGAIPLVPLDINESAAYAELTDGLIFPGGMGYSPLPYANEYYTRENHARKESMEDELYKEFKARRKPVFGICDGGQKVNCVQGGSLQLSVYKNYRTSHTLTSHPIKTEPGSFINRVWGDEPVTNSYHNFSADESKLGEDIIITARTEDGVIEAVEVKGYPVYGFQFHPERMRGDNIFPAEGADGDKLIGAFIKECAERR